MIFHLTRGFLIGLLLAIPIGPVSLLFVQSNISRGIKQGILFGLGVATADALYAAIIGFGVTGILSILHESVWGLRIISLLIIMWLAYNLLRTREEIQPSEDDLKRVRLTRNSFLLAFSITIMSPLTAVIIVGLATEFNVILKTNNLIHVVFLITGVFWGSFLWWILLSYSIQKLKLRLSQDRIQKTNRIIGIGLIGLILYVYIKDIVTG